VIDEFNAFLYVEPAEGEPAVGVKDVIDVAGMPTTAASRILHRVPERDATCVARLRAAGAAIVGKLNLHEFAYGALTNSPHFGPALNPWNPEHTTGGSSGGSGAAVAAGLVGAASGSDGAGSIRIPAANCGVFGLKPQRGRVPMTPDPYVEDSEHWHGLSVNGVLTRTVADTALYLDVTAGPVPGEWEAPAPPARSFTESASTPPGKLRIACSLEAPRLLAPPEKVDDANRRGYDETRELLRSLGHEVTERAPEFDWVGNAFTPLYLGGIRQDIKRTPHPERLESRTRGFSLLGAPYGGRLAASAKRAIAKHSKRINRLFDDHDVLITLISPVRPVEVGRWEGKGALRTVIGMSRVYPYTGVWNYLGNPAASVPAGIGDDGLPLAVQLVGRPEDEGTLLSLAAQIEAERPWADARPPDA
jgi:amidase